MAAVETGRALEHLVEPPRIRPVRRRVPRALALGTVIVGSAVALPAIYLVVRAADAGSAGVGAVLTDARTLGLLGRTVLLAAAVTASCLAIGVPIAWLTARTDLPARRTLSVLTVLPLVIPSYVGAYAFIAALGPRGILQGWLEPLGVQRLPEIYGFFGAWLALTLFSYPYVVLTVRAAIRRIDPALEEAARSLGGGRRAVLRRVIIPQLRPSIAAGGLLVALYTIHDFGAVSLLRFDTFTRAIYVSYQGSFDRSRAAILGLVLIALTLVVLALEARSRGRAAYHAQRPSRPARPTQLGAWRWPAFAGVASILTVSLALPVGVILSWAIRSERSAGELSDTLLGGLHSLSASGLAALVAVVAAWPVALLAARFPGRLARLGERASYVGYALPGVVVALSLVFFATRVTPGIYQTLGLLVFAYVVLFLPQATGAMRASLLQVGPQLEEASRSLGHGRLATARRVLVPLVRPGVLAGAALVFLTAMKELPATLLLAPTGFRTLSTEVWNATNAAFFDRAAVPALGLLLLASVPLAILMIHERRSER